MSRLLQLLPLPACGCCWGEWRQDVWCFAYPQVPLPLLRVAAGVTGGRAWGGADMDRRVTCLVAVLFDRSSVVRGQAATSLTAYMYLASLTTPCHSTPMCHTPAPCHHLLMACFVTTGVGAVVGGWVHLCLLWIVPMRDVCRA